MNGLEHVTVLVVEDTLQIRSLLISVMRQVGVGNILRAGDGMEATELMREMRHNPVRVGASEIDIIISDWVMSPVDGGTLLRWVRRHQDSPDPFMTFFMISGYSDEERVRAARDLGVTEFIAKPFRIDDIITHVEASVRDERRFVKTPDYFGPDRRRQFVLVAEERRGVAEDKATFIDPPRRLYTKVGGELSLDRALVQSAQQHADDLHQDFADWVQEDLAKLEDAFIKVMVSGSQNIRATALATMCRICHELRGQGGVFGYPLVSDVSESLFKLSNNITAIPEDGLKLIRTHIDLLKAIIREDVAGDGGPLGQELMSTLKVANFNFINKPENKRMVNREFARLAEGSGRPSMRSATG
jgi:CheY-like chemotaxis protein